ncbi:MAG TPA: hypothetical protein VNT01_18035 [Symbiobacteriaceae bacterium]|nr:hypothetical protein [Symbiobacteriaceae bacterium]
MSNRSLLERVVGGLAHLITLAGVLHLLINMIGFPLFPKSTILWLVPNTIFAVLSFRWSRYVYSHVVQALTLHLAGISLAAVPMLIRLASIAGLLGERWYYTGWNGSGATPVWSLMVMIISLLGLVLFTVTCEAAVRGFTGEPFQYPLVGRLARRIAK